MKKPIPSNDTSFLVWVQRRRSPAHPTPSVVVASLSHPSRASCPSLRGRLYLATGPHPQPSSPCACVAQPPPHTRLSCRATASSPNPQLSLLSLRLRGATSTTCLSSQATASNSHPSMRG